MGGYRWFFVVAAYAVSSASIAERYLDFVPGATIGDVKRQLPNARIEELKPAWLQPHQHLIQLSGPGIDGLVALLFVDELATAKQALSQFGAKTERNEALTSTEKFLANIYEARVRRYGSTPGEERWRLDDIRWQPSVPFSLSRFVARYGKPEAEEIREDMKRTKLWKKRGITAFLDDDDKVNLVVYTFTSNDWLCAKKWEAKENCDPLDPFPEERGYRQAEPR